eukprot:914372-Pleurochrysis_carterae.AAC.1
MARRGRRAFPAGRAEGESDAEAEIDSHLETVGDAPNAAQQEAMGEGQHPRKQASNRDRHDTKDKNHNDREESQKGNNLSENASDDQSDEPKPVATRSSRKAAEEGPVASSDAAHDGLCKKSEGCMRPAGHVGLCRASRRDSGKGFATVENPYSKKQLYRAAVEVVSSTPTMTARGGVAKKAGVGKANGAVNSSVIGSALASSGPGESGGLLPASAASASDPEKPTDAERGDDADAA